MRLSAHISRLKHRAKRMARDEGIALHAALDRVAEGEGFARWSLLSSRMGRETSRATLLPKLAEGDLLLIGARPGHGKTRLGLQLLVDAAREGRRAVFFTLEYSERETRDRLRTWARNEDSDGVEIVASDDICADTVLRRLSGSSRGTVAVIDYLQILDQRRAKPPLSEQMQTLRQSARSDGFILGFLSQIDRTFDPLRNPVPVLQDIRLPNPIETTLFSKACFLHDDMMQFQNIA